MLERAPGQPRRQDPVWAAPAGQVPLLARRHWSSSGAAPGCRPSTGVPRPRQDPPAQEYAGVPLGRAGLRRKCGVTIVAVKSPGEAFTYATAETELSYSDTVIVSGRTGQVERFAELP
ncbi:TrkA C-terminal domain-containing protein [Nonomuraea sp. NPDC000554]|uniref:cation:proton antiporter regulatory subunit n=1 Tax=Nonomuraea sp. NPDC000554 TaxID=3154259 RepID=UPI003331E7B5